MHEMGIIEKIIQTTTTKKLNYTGILTDIKMENIKNQQQQNLFVLKLIDLFSIFVIWNIGLAISSITFLFEILRKHFINKKFIFCTD